MKRILTILAFLAFGTQAQADNYAATAGSGLTFAAKNVGGILFPWSIPANSSGTELFTSSNAGYVRFPSAQAVTLTSTTLTGTLPAYAATPTFNCGTGCGAGGSTSNASSGVATSSTNGPTVSYNYGVNGITWDQL